MLTVSICYSASEPGKAWKIFGPGDVVSFRAEDGQTVTGILVRLNKKTVTVHTESGARWNVAPQLLTRIKRQLGSENLPDNTVEKKLH
ncbi:hypothetical protein LNP02_28445 [Klebsiella variicola subsp. variicola]|nr:hypothetical protein [Klebsiella variicola subsp. variicola]